MGWSWRLRPIPKDGSAQASSSGGLVGIAGGEPFAPCGLFEGVSYGLGAPEIGVGAGLVDEVPGEKRDGVESLCNRRDVFGLRVPGDGVEVGVFAAEVLRQEGEEVELDGQVVVAGAHEEGFDGAQGVFGHGAVWADERVPAGPEAAADHVEALAVDLRHVLVPDPGVGFREIEAGDVARHVRGADDGEGLAVELEVVGANGEFRAGKEIVPVAYPEAGTVDAQGLAVAQEGGFDGVEAFSNGGPGREGNGLGGVGGDSEVGGRGVVFGGDADFELVARGPAGAGSVGFEVEGKRLAGEKERYARAEGEAVGLAGGEVGERREQLGVREEGGVEVTGGEDPAASDEAVLVVIDFEDGCGELVAVAGAPGECGEVEVFVAG